MDPSYSHRNFCVSRGFSSRFADLPTGCSQEHMDDTYVDSAKQEDMVEEADDEFEQEVFQYDDNYD